MKNNGRKNRKKANFNVKVTLIDIMRSLQIIFFVLLLRLERPFNCDICLKAFSHSKGLNQHRETHTSEKRFKCDLCNKKFSRSAYLKQHLSAHSDVKQFECGICSKQFTYSSGLSGHRRRIHRGKEFGYSSALIKHRRVHVISSDKDNELECEICKMRFASFHQLNLHIDFKHR